MRNEDLEFKLWEYLDGDLSMDEKASIDHLLLSDQELNAEFLAMKAIHTSLEQPEVVILSPDFAKNIIGQLDPPTSSMFDIKWIIASSLILVLLALSFVVFGWMPSTSESTFDISRLVVPIPRLNEKYFLIFALLPFLLFFDRWLSKNVKGGFGHHFMLSI